MSRRGHPPEVGFLILSNDIYFRKSAITALKGLIRILFIKAEVAAVMTTSSTFMTEGKNNFFYDINYVNIKEHQPGVDDSAAAMGSVKRLRFLSSGWAGNFWGHDFQQFFRH